LGRHVFDQIALGKWRAPILGLMAAHILLIAEECADADPPGGTSIRFDRDDFEIILRNTARLLGENHPDIVALRTRSEKFQLPDKVEISTPPIFWRSWDMLLKATRPGQPALVRDNLWRRVRETSNFAPFFSWFRADTIPAAQRPSVEKALFRELSDPVMVDREARQPEGAAFALSRRGSGKPDLSELASYAPKPQLQQMVRQAETAEHAIEAVATYGRLPYSAAQKLFDNSTASELIARLRK